MPYIEPHRRVQYEDVLKELPDIENKGDLEFCLFYLLQQFMSTREQRYSTLHEAVYAAMHVADEFRRRFLDARENTAILQNGDVQL